MNFSVLISVYKNDNPNYLQQALDSIENQTRIPSEVVLVVDGPISESLDNIIKEMSNKYSNIKLVRIEKNIGLGNALAMGMKYCSNNIIARMDSDDISVRDRFEKQIKCFEEDSELSIVGSNIDEFENEVCNIVGKRKVPTIDHEIKKYIKYRCPFNHVSVMFKKDSVELAGGYLDWFYNEDYYLWLRMYIKKCKFRNIDESLVRVRVGEEMYMRRGGKQYFKSEFELQKYMHEEGIINWYEFAFNVFTRFIVQRMFSNKLRGIVFKKIFRETN
ncbi:glycosyltransferase [Clostridium paraputrificum]|uniref:glycosyltransferase n=1 Tax=Clostridium paraputrificum TaxID=29363 RepID=UPI0023310927|nr:glycosyltransferase [Clostridium paraputrificum]MDB2106216.1 glycosyltransferase [Clostridium paraputrificum]MDB2112907.1 glycosyltransferase [Clostridium paraputrificum]